MNSSIVLVAGSPASQSRSSALLDTFGGALSARGFSTTRFSLADFPLEDLVHGRAESEPIRRFLSEVQRAHGIVFSTPTYKATFAGALKIIIDLLAPSALEGKTALAITSARLEPHLALIDDSFQRLYRFFKGSKGLASLGVLDEQLIYSAASVSNASGGPQLELDETAQRAFDAALERFSAVQLERNSALM
jgi:FMN reductase